MLHDALLGGVAMDPAYILACGIVWRKTSDPEAGWELIEGLESSDACVRLLARDFLVENCESSMGLLESAVATGRVSPEAAGPCMAEILQGGGNPGGTSKQYVGDAWLS
jgi:hypothetical protein